MRIDSAPQENSGIRQADAFGFMTEMHALAKSQFGIVLNFARNASNRP